MKNKAIGKDHYNVYARAVILFLLAMLAGILIFFYQVQKDVEENIEEIIIGHVERQRDHFNSILDQQYKYLEGIAAVLGKQDDLNRPENIELIRSVREKSDLNTVGIIDSSGFSTYDNGMHKSVAGREYFEEAMKGRRSLSDPLESELDGETKVILGVPIYHDGTVAGVLGGSYDMGALSRMLFEDLYHGEGYSFIVTRDGTMVSLDRSKNGPGIGVSDNFFDYYANVRFLNDISIDDIRGDFEKYRHGYVELKNEGNDRYLTYVPLGLNEWVLCYVVPRDMAQESYRFIRKHEFVLSGFLVIAVLLLFWHIARINNHRQKDLLRSAQTDELTGIYNKKSTEEKIGRWLGSDECAGLQVFLMLDIDMFKEINDNYGHAAGDQVLRQVGGALRRQFRESDILGRVGGDEFIVFMKNVGSEEDAEKRIRGLAETLRQIEIPGIAGKHITSSMGAAFAPVHGMNYEELYLSADKALYETKRNGRNGYTVYRR